MLAILVISIQMELFVCYCFPYIIGICDLMPVDAHRYIPILPLSMFVYLECPTPFLMGLHSCYTEKALDLLDKDVVLVDLDNDEVVCRTVEKSQVAPRYLLPMQICVIYVCVCVIAITSELPNPFVISDAAFVFPNINNT
jgi:hypothetical protein